MLKLKQSHRDPEEWIIYEPGNFQNCHTHCRHLRVALKIKYLVLHEELPISKSVRFINSCIRVSSEGAYKEALMQYRNLLLKGGNIREETPPSENAEAGNTEGSQEQG